MAANNFFNAVNASGAALSVNVDGKTIKIDNDGEQSTGHTFQSGEDITITIAGTPVKLNLPGGTNSWSTLVFTNQGLVNIFPSASNQGSIGY